MGLSQLKEPHARQKDSPGWTRYLLLAARKVLIANKPHTPQTEARSKKKFLLFLLFLLVLLVFQAEPAAK